MRASKEYRKGFTEESTPPGEAAEEDAEEEARHRADLEERTNKAKAATCWERACRRPSSII